MEAERIMVFFCREIWVVLKRFASDLMQESHFLLHRKFTETQLAVKVKHVAIHCEPSVQPSI